ncbi:MAG TPA: pyridoxamine 5'-phosphate oxidase family protein [Anaerolineaceae bacterium]|nr:pyridoxamine 5'-phosphate oxidase family protein [Anaerolineaceae bacterium]
MDKIDLFLSQTVLARLGTADPRTLQPHVVPVWFLWEDGAAWVSAFSSTRKVKELRANPRCALLVDLLEAKDGLTAVLLEGPGELITDPAQVSAIALKIYTKYLGPEGVLAKAPQDWLVSPENTILKLVPEKIRSW